jgi:hypothetical protein
MALTVRLLLDGDALPELGALRDALASELDTEVRLDEDSEVALTRPRRLDSALRWPADDVGFFVPGAATRGVHIEARGESTRVSLRLMLHAISTWTDWRLLAELVSLLGMRSTLPAQVASEGDWDPKELRRALLASPDRWRAEGRAGLAALRAAVRDGKIVRIGGPAGLAAVGPRVWARLGAELRAEGAPRDVQRALDADGAPEVAEDIVVERVVAMLRDSIAGRGYERYYNANLLRLDGRIGREVTACLLPPGVDTLIRAPEYVLLSRNLEGGPDEPSFLLPFEQIDRFAVGRVRWLDERSAAIAAIPRERFVEQMDAISDLLLPLQAALDGEDEARAPSWRRYGPDGAC